MGTDERTSFITAKPSFMELHGLLTRLLRVHIRMNTTIYDTQSTLVMIYKNMHHAEVRAPFLDISFQRAPEACSLDPIFNQEK